MKLIIDVFHIHLAGGASVVSCDLRRRPLLLWCNRYLQLVVNKAI